MKCSFYSSEQHLLRILFSLVGTLLAAVYYIYCGTGGASLAFKNGFVMFSVYTCIPLGLQNIFAVLTFERGPEKNKFGPSRDSDLHLGVAFILTGLLVYVNNAELTLGGRRSVADDISCFRGLAYGMYVAPIIVPIAAITHHPLTQTEHEPDPS